MAIESLGGGIADQLAQLPSDAVRLLEEVLKDTVGGIASVSHPAPGITTIISLGQGQPGAGDVIQTAFLATEPASNVPMSDGSVTLRVSVPDNTVVTMEGPVAPITPEDANIYLRALLDEAIPPSSPDPVAQAERQQIEEMIDLITPTTGTAQQRLETAIDQAQQSLVKASEATMPTAEEHVRVMQIKPPQDATEPVKLDFSGTPGDVVNVLVAQTGAKVEVVDAKAVGFVGTGEVTVTTTDGSGTLVVGDAFAQKLDGSQNSGHDTLIGGAGNDTLVGGAGDVIGFNGLGHFTVVGTEKGVSFTFLFEGIHSVQDLAQFLTGITETASGVTFHFGDAASITLVGVSASQVTADMIHFNL